MNAARSWLFVPGDSQRKIAGALQGEAEALIFDWEDAVAAANKPVARCATIAALAASHPPAARCWVRLNALDTPHFADDIAALPAAAIAGVMLPKACGPADVARLGRELERVEAHAGLPAQTLSIVLIATETAAAVLALAEFRQPLPRLTAMLWGGEDLTGDLGIARNRDGQGGYRAPFLLARNLMLMAAAATGALAIDAVYVDVRDNDGLRIESEEARADGFLAKAAIHPGQIPVINQVFSASEAERNWAARVVEALDGGKSGLAVIDGKMVDAPHLRLAQRILSR
jgi:citrate lyase subunit beta/citryl-CoA lyase